MPCVGLRPPEEGLHQQVRRAERDRVPRVHGHRPELLRERHRDPQEGRSPGAGGRGGEDSGGGRGQGEVPVQGV